MRRKINDEIFYNQYFQTPVKQPESNGGGGRRGDGDRNAGCGVYMSCERR